MKIPRQVILVKLSNAVEDTDRLKALANFYDIIIVRDEDFDDAVETYTEVAKNAGREVNGSEKDSDANKKQRSESDSVSASSGSSE